jgi:hypothetical protein
LAGAVEGNNSFSRTLIKLGQSPIELGEAKATITIFMVSITAETNQKQFIFLSVPVLHFHHTMVAITAGSSAAQMQALMKLGQAMRNNSWLR